MSALDKELAATKAKLNAASSKTRKVGPRMPLSHCAPCCHSAAAAALACMLALAIAGYGWSVLLTHAFRMCLTNNKT